MSQAPPGGVFSSAAPAATADPAVKDSISAPASVAQATLVFQGLLREIRAESQNLQQCLEGIKEKTSLTDDETRAKEVANALADGQDVVDRNRHQINTLLRSVRELFGKHPTIYDWCSDEVAHIENCWDRVDASWPTIDQTTEQSLEKIERVGQSLNKLIYLCGQLTIPARVNQHLESLRVGQSFDFHKHFGDELNTQEDRARLLGYMSDHPAVISGVVDAERGIIYRASKKAWRRAVSYVMLTIVLLAGFGLIFVIANLKQWTGLENWPPAERSGEPAERFGELAMAYVFLIAGGVAHMLVDALKQARADTASGLVAVKDWLLWLHVKESALVMAILYLWIGLLGLTFSLDEIQWMTAFFVGYSIDSFVDLFLQRFSETASRMTDAQKKIAQA